MRISSLILGASLLALPAQAREVERRTVNIPVAKTNGTVIAIGQCGSVLDDLTDPHYCIASIRLDSGRVVTWSVSGPHQLGERIYWWPGE